PFVAPLLFLGLVSLDVTDLAVQLCPFRGREVVPLEVSLELVDRLVSRVAHSDGSPTVDSASRAASAERPPCPAIALSAVGRTWYFALVGFLVSASRASRASSACRSCAASASAVARAASALARAASTFLRSASPRAF